MTSSVLYVFKNNPPRTLIGKLTFDFSGVSFEYHPAYLSDPNSLSINPFQLPLNASSSRFTENKLEGALSVFNDALPGKWGRCVLEKLKNSSLPDCDVLLSSQADRIGDLIFSKDKRFPSLDYEGASFNFEWAALLEAKDCIENHHPLTDKQKLWLKQGSSQGGARPKISVMRDGVLFMAKLPSIHDYRLNVAQIEHGTLCLAKHCGISAVESQLIKVDDKDILLVKRFDRDEYQSIPYLSLASVCGLRSGSEGSYLQFAQEMARFGAANDLTELYKRMVFNILVSNKDDHAFNHGLLFKDDRWFLSPAFDIVTGEGQSRAQSIRVGDYNRESTLRNALSRSQDFRLTKADARQVIDTMVNAINDWNQVFLDNGVSQVMVDEVSWAVGHSDVFSEYGGLSIEDDAGRGL
jgi:serine/threonine-protein kinase HipA